MRSTRGWLWPITMILLLAVPAAASAAAQRFVYVSNGFPTASNKVSALRINANGSLTPVAGSPYSTAGTVTEGIAITPDAENVYVAHFGTHNVSGFSVRTDGGLNQLAGSPFAAGLNDLGVAPDPDGGHLFAWNHGAAIAVLNIAAGGGLAQIGGSPFAVAAGYQNPFAGSVAPDGDRLYVPNENTSPAGGAPDKVTVYSVAANGALAPLQNATAGGPAAADGNPFGSGITPDGRFLYVSAPEDNAGAGNIYGFSISANGLLSPVPGSPFNNAPGSHPLNIAIAPDGDHLYVATRITNTVNAYTINNNGSLTPVPGQPFATGGLNGKALALTPDGKRLYVSNNGSDNISGFNVANNGALTLIPGSPWPTGSDDPDLESIVITPNQPPVAAFSAQNGEAGRQPAKFNANISDDSDGGTIDTYAWDFGDGTTLANGGPTPQHIYAQPGTYTVTLKVTDNEGCSTGRIFTGKATLCNGSAVADSSEQVTITAPPCAGKPSTIIGTSGSDTLDGTAGPDVISGLGAGDAIRGFGGNDIICAGQGIDTVKGGRGNDRIRGGSGGDDLFGNDGNDRLNGGKGRDRLFGGRGDDVLFGGPGLDQLFGGPGDDRKLQ